MCTQSAVRHSVQMLFTLCCTGNTPEHLPASTRRDLSLCVCVCVCVCVLCKHIWRVRSSFVKLSGNLSSFCFTWEAAVYTHTHTHTHTQILLWDGRQMRSAAAGCRCVWSFINPLLSMRTWWCHWSEEDFTSFSQNLIQIYLKLYLKLL